MLTGFFKKRKVTGIPKLKFTIDMNMRDYSDCPFFKQKFEMAKASIAKYGVPNMRSFYEDEAKANAGHEG